MGFGLNFDQLDTKGIFNYNRRDGASAMFVQNGMDNIDVIHVYRKGIKRFVDRLQRCKNSIVLVLNT